MSADEAKPLRENTIWPWLQVIGMGFVGMGGILSILGMVGNYVPVVCGAAPNLDAPAFTPDQIPQFVLMMTFYAIGMLLVQFVAGHIWLKVKTPILMFVCFTVPMICLALMGTYTQLWQWWLSFFIIGIFGGCIYMLAGANILFNWFAKNVAVSMSIAAVLSGIGQAVLSPIHQFFIAEFGWRMAYPMGAALGCLLGLPWIIFVLRFRPEDKGVRPYGWKPGTVKLTAGDVDSPGASIKKSLLSVTFIAMFIGMGLMALFGGYQNLWGSFAIEFSVGPEGQHWWGDIDPLVVSSYMISATGLFNLVMPLLGLVIDKIGAAYASFIILVIQILAALGMLYLHSSWVALVIFVFLFADINGIMLGTGGILIRSIFGARNFTKINSYFQIAVGGVGGFGAPVIGMVAVAAGTYTATLWMAIGLCLVIGLLFIIAFLFAKKVVWEDGTIPNPWAKYAPAVAAVEEGAAE
ncbi:MAG: MFS transporter [Coriobacteriales bacterium]|jgi:MFS family permease|nr:MFS transporter [Coriobacteriales bacterium]